uniref:Uncharacterized protein n=1 Tax=Anguilla anguilla TaxID=7936 RepID=A0A0E9XVY2_ANGAN
MRKHSLSCNCDPSPLFQRCVNEAHIPTDWLQRVWGCCVLSYWLPH